MEITEQDVMAWLDARTAAELIAFKRGLEARWGVKATAEAPPASQQVVPAPVEEQTEFTVTLTDTGQDRIGAIKEIRSITGLGLKEAKDLVDRVPTPVKIDVGRDEADAIKKRLEAVGAKVEIR